MSPERILITGGSGLLALNWACCMRAEHEVVLGQHLRTVRLAGTRTEPLTLENEALLARQLERIAPGVVVHAAGLTSVDQCEREPAQAHEANAILARNVAAATARLGIALIHISTDHLFAGTRSFYREDDAPEPLNVYAQTKLLAEQWVAQAHPRALIVRTNFFGWGHRLRQSFSDWILASLAQAKPLTMFDDVFFTPLLADRLAAAAHRLLARGAAGVLHVAGDERLSKYDFAVALARAFGHPEALVRRGKIRGARLLAQRPSDMSLSNARAREALGDSLGCASEYFPELLQQDRRGRREELLASIAE
jgi:dTDP-4-dehydrorhamnose reductase